MHRIFGGMDSSNYIWGEKIIIRSLAKDGYTRLLMTDGRLETHLNNDLIWTSYFIGEGYAEAKLSDTVDLMTGEIYA